MVASWPFMARRIQVLQRKDRKVGKVKKKPGILKEQQQDPETGTKMNTRFNKSNWNMYE
jgi:hypothetical protein